LQEKPPNTKMLDTRIKQTVAMNIYPPLEYLQVWFNSPSQATVSMLQSFYLKVLTRDQNLKHLQKILKLLSRYLAREYRNALVTDHVTPAGLFAFYRKCEEYLQYIEASA
jgi:hypothetical protein